MSPILDGFSRLVQNQFVIMLYVQPTWCCLYTCENVIWNACLVKKQKQITPSLFPIIVGATLLRVGSTEPTEILKKIMYIFDVLVKIWTFNTY